VKLKDIYNSTSKAILKQLNCNQDDCKLRITDHSGLDQCLMEVTRRHWSLPSAEHYCADPAARKFVEVFMLKSSGDIK
jgi:hypothetical protein